jgi:hypothetical protein
MRTKWGDLTKWWSDPTNQYLVGTLGVIAFSMSLLGAICSEGSWTPRMDPTRATVCGIGLVMAAAASVSQLWYYHKVRLGLAQLSSMLVLAGIGHMIESF